MNDTSWMPASHTSCAVTACLQQQTVQRQEESFKKEESCAWHPAAFQQMPVADVEDFVLMLSHCMHALLAEWSAAV
jgi:hypothetical protein